MEPVAPGTEGEQNSNLHSYDKKANEEERLLSLKTYLPTGTYGNVFELTFFSGAEHWYCNLCECPVLGRVYHHEIGKRHTNNMTMAGLQNSCESSILPIQIAPGEPVPPGFEGEIEKVAAIQERLDNFTVGPLVGLEYLLEIQEYEKEVEPSYLCMLCDKRGDPRTVIAHLASFNHISQYLQKHFSACYSLLSPYITRQYKRNWQAAMQKIAEAIETKFGRLKPHVVERDSFEKKRVQYKNLIFNAPHFNEKLGFTFEDLINREELTKSIKNDSFGISKPSEEALKRVYRRSGTEPGSSDAGKVAKHSPSPPVVAKPKKPKPSKPNEQRRSLSSVSTISSSDLSDFDGLNQKEKVPKEFRGRSPAKRFNRPNQNPFNKRNFKYNKRPQSPRMAKAKSPPRGERLRQRSPPKRDKYMRRSPQRLPLHPWERPDYIRPQNVGNDKNKVKNDKLDEYRRLSTAIENDMENVLKQHEKNPEKHPQYNDEWKKFWNKRYKELQAEGKDASNYDFKPEWINFWNKRMLELHNIEVKVKKDALRKRLGLAEELAPISFKISNKRKFGQREDSKERKLTPPSSTYDQDPDVIIIDDKDDDTVSSHSPWESETIVRQPNKGPDKDRRYSADRNWEHNRKGQVRENRSRGRDSRDRRLSRSPNRLSRERVSRDRESRDRDKRSPDRERSREKSRDRYYFSYKNELPDYCKPPRVLRDVTRHPVMSPPLYDLKKKVTVTVELEDESEVNIVSVLRLLTALEEKLGSLGPKVIDLLGQALALEKNFANSSETLLDNEVTCMIFETVKEKLKGQLLAGLVEVHQEKAFKNAIKKIASLIHMTSERKKQQLKEKPKVDPVKVPGVGTVDKAAIARQIATALVLQGKTDVTQEELEQLINAVVGMAEASRNANKLITTASFLQQLNTQTETPTETPTEIPIKKVEAPSATFQSLQNSQNEIGSNSMEGLSDSDLQTLLQNFKDLSTDEQHGLISYLKKLEAVEPERVERLRKFVNLGAKEEKKEEAQESGRTSPFSTRTGSVNPTVDDNKNNKIVAPEKSEVKLEKIKINIDSEDEDYSYEDVFNAATKNVKEKELEKERKIVEDSMKFEPKKDSVDLTDAKAIIANIMGQFSMKSNSGPNLLGMGTSGTRLKTEHPNQTDGNKEQPSGVNKAPDLKFPKETDLTEAFNNFPINIASLVNIVGSFQDKKNVVKSEPVVSTSDWSRNDSFQAQQMENEMDGFNMKFDPPNVQHNVPYGSNFIDPHVNMNQPPIMPDMSRNVQYPIRNQNTNFYPENDDYLYGNVPRNIPFGNQPPNNFNPPFEAPNRPTNPYYNARGGNAPNQYNRTGNFGNYNNRW